MADETLTAEQARRQAALRGMDAFADKHGCSNREWREVDQGESIGFIGVADDGREFALGYMKASEQERSQHDAA